MTNNLKAERTLTAEDYVSGERLSELIAILEAKWGWTQDEQDTFRTLKELQHLRSQSLSTQQPMGEVTDEMAKRASIFLWNNVGLMDFAHATGPDDLDEIMKSAIQAALLPNQESGE